MTTPSPIPGFYQLPANQRAVFGRSGPNRPLGEVQKDFVKVLLSMSEHSFASDAFRRWAEFWAYSIASDVANTPMRTDGDEELARLTAWRKQLEERRSHAEQAMAGLCKDWKTHAIRLMELMGEGLEAAQGDFLSAVLERGLQGTNKWNGQFFTPGHIATLMGKCLAPSPRPGWVETVCDPCCGCGSLPIGGVIGYLTAGGSIEDVCVVAADIDEGSVCACYIQLCGLGISAKAQCMDSLRMEPRGPMMATPFYVLYETQRRLKMQGLIETMDELLRDGPGKAPESAQDASEATGGTDGGGEAENAPGSDFEAPTGHTAGAEASEPPTLHEEAAAAIPGGQRQGILPGFE